MKELKYQLDKQSAKGALTVVRPNEDREEISLVYTTKEKKKKTKFHNYVFDYDFNKVFDEAGEEPKFKKKGSRGKYRGEAYEYDAVSMEPNLTGVLVAKIEHVSGKWSGFLGRYIEKRKFLKKEKLKTADDRKILMDRQWGLENGDALVLGKPKLRPKDYKTKSGVRLLIRVNNKLEIIEEVPFDFGYATSVVSAWVVGKYYYAIYAPMKLAGTPKAKDPTAYSLVKINTETTKIELNKKFNAKIGDWNVQSTVMSEDGSIVFVGPGNEGKHEKLQTFPVTPGLVKFDAFQVVTLKPNGDIKVSMCTNDDINKKGVKYPTEKKLTKYNGKKYEFRSAEVLPSGGVVVSLQDWKMAKLKDPVGIGFSDRKVFLETIFIHFNGNGELVGYYPVPGAKKEGLSNSLDVRQYANDYVVFEDNDPNKLNILIIQPHHTEQIWSYDTDLGLTANGGVTTTTTKTVTATPVYFPRFVQIDTKSRSFSKTKDIGDQKYFMYDSQSVFPINGGKEIIFLGEGKGRILYMAKFDLTQD